MNASSGAFTSAIEDGLTGHSDIQHLSANGSSSVMAYTPVVGTDWVLLYNVPRKTAFALQTHVTKNIGILVLMAILSLLAVGLTIGRGTAKSLESVSGTADQIAAGDLNTELPETTREDEMGQLYGSFESMHVYLNTVADQADALARQEFDAPVLDESVPGEFGETLEQMRDDLRTMVTDLERSRAEAEEAKAERRGGSIERRESTGRSGATQRVARSESRRVQRRDGSGRRRRPDPSEWRPRAQPSRCRTSRRGSTG